MILVEGNSGGIGIKGVYFEQFYVDRAWYTHTDSEGTLWYQGMRVHSPTQKSLVAFPLSKVVRIGDDAIMNNLDLIS